MESLSLRTKISVLWIFMDFAFLLQLTLNNLDPGGGLKQMLAGIPAQQLPLVLLGGAVVLLAPFVLAILSLTLKDSSGRLANVTVGLVFVILALVWRSV